MLVLLSYDMFLKTHAATCNIIDKTCNDGAICLNIPVH